jgi:hypothetical protein
MYPRFPNWPSKRFEASQLGPRGGGGRGSPKSGEADGCSRPRAGGGWPEGLLGSAWGLGRGGERAGEGARWHPAAMAAASYNSCELGAVQGGKQVLELEWILWRRPRWSVGSGIQWRGELSEERQWRWWRSTGRERRRMDAWGEMRGTFYRHMASPWSREGNRGADGHRVGAQGGDQQQTRAGPCAAGAGRDTPRRELQTPRCARASTCVTSGDTGGRTRTPKARERHASTRARRARRSAALWSAGARDLALIVPTNPVWLACSPKIWIEVHCRVNSKVVDQVSLYNFYKGHPMFFSMVWEGTSSKVLVFPGTDE